MTISVVIATYNGAKYISNQFTSVLAQTFPPKEIIVSDDNSSDDTLEIVTRLAAGRGVDVRIIRRDPGLGFRENFLRAAVEATGDFIAFCDQDDIWEKTKLERCSRHFGNPAVSLIVHPAATIDAASRVVGEFRQGIDGTKLVPPLSYDPWGTFYGFSIVFRRDLLALYPIAKRFTDYVAPAHLTAHDRWITFLGQNVGETVEIDEKLVGYRQHDTNLFGKDKARLSAPPEDLARRSAVYIRATKQMIEIVRGLDETAAAAFPRFDRARSIAFYEHALAQLRSRDAVYRAKTRLGSVIAATAVALHGRYRSVNDRKIRWNSLARDLQFAMTRA